MPLRQKPPSAAIVASSIGLWLADVEAISQVNRMLTAISIGVTMIVASHSVDVSVVSTSLVLSCAAIAFIMYLQELIEHGHSDENLLFVK